MVQSCNVICQRILEDGKHCMERSVILHHLVSPHVDLSKAFDPSNTVMVCRSHHPRTAGEPEDSQNEYTPTIFRVMGKEYIYPHPKPEKPRKGIIRFDAHGFGSIG